MLSLIYVPNMLIVISSKKESMILYKQYITERVVEQIVTPRNSLSTEV